MTRRPFYLTPSCGPRHAPDVIVAVVRDYDWDQLIRHDIASIRFEVSGFLQQKKAYGIWLSRVLLLAAKNLILDQFRIAQLDRSQF